MTMMIPVTILLDPVRQPLLRAADLNHRHDRRAADGSHHRSLAAEQAAAADDHRGDHVQFEADGDRRVADKRENWKIPARPAKIADNV